LTSHKILNRRVPTVGISLPRPVLDISNLRRIANMLSVLSFPVVGLCLSACCGCSCGFIIMMWTVTCLKPPVEKSDTKGRKSHGRRSYIALPMVDIPPIDS
jgi:hypothetical protein